MSNKVQQMPSAPRLHLAKPSREPVQILGTDLCACTCTGISSAKAPHLSELTINSGASPSPNWTSARIEVCHLLRASMEALMELLAHGSCEEVLASS